MAPADPRPCEEALGQELASYWDVQIPGRYFLDMVFESGEWRPADPIPMPNHHATRLELGNLGELPWLAQHREKRLRFTIDLTARELREAPGRGEWRATYFARVVDVCLPRAG